MLTRTSGLRPLDVTARAFVCAALLVAALGLAACGKSGGTSSAPSTGPDYPVTIGSLTLAKQPTKIVSLAPTTTEMLYAIGAGKQVVAVDDQSNYPADAPKTNLSGFKPNAEAVAAKNPDLVVLSNDTNSIVDQLSKLKVPVLLAPAAKTLDDTYGQITDLGKLTGHSGEAADLVKRMKDDITKLVKDLPQRPKRLTYYHELDPTFYTATSKTFLGSLYAMAGLDNIADPADPSGASGGYPQLSAEAIVKANPDLIFLGDTKCCQQNAETVAKRPGWSGIAAVRNGHVQPLDDDIASRWGPRIVDFLRAITDAVAKVPS
jgi:iron complex transport system substrate-binding protein